MLKRIYINNFKCLVNFDLKIDTTMSLLLGTNGTGKTTLFLALLKLQQFIIDGKTVIELFKPADLTKWQDSLFQNFELEIAGNDGIYKYSLTIEHQGSLARMQQESLLFNNNPLFEFKTGTAQLYDDDYTKGPKFLSDWSRSGISALQERRNNQKLTWFKKRMMRFFIVHINPTTMNSESRQEEIKPNWEMSNYVAWFRYLSQEYQGKVFNLTIELRDILAGFNAFKIIQAGEAKILAVEFLNKSVSKKPIIYKWHELSDGQRVLIALYTLIYCTPDEDYSLCIDEPENFLALPEIQPWLDNLYEQCQNNHAQALLISHHPKLINYLASHAGYWFSRTDNGLVRTQTVTEQDESGLSIAELITRGWIYDD